MSSAIIHFFSLPKFAVVGASSDAAKFGHRVFQWYLAHTLPVTPINPTSSTITVNGDAYATRASPSALDDAYARALSIVTPPKVTLAVLKEAADAGVSAVWLQPGSFDDEGLAFAQHNFTTTIAGHESDAAGAHTSGHEGWCILVDGENGLKLANRTWKKPEVRPKL